MPTLGLGFKVQRGQIKSRGIPRLNREHPLAQGLLFYGYDTGTGIILDLVNNRAGAHVPGTTLAGPSASIAGQTINWNNSDGIYFNSDAPIRNATAGGVFTAACACVSNSNSQGSYAAIFGRTAYNSTQQPYVNWQFQYNPNGDGQNYIGYSFNNAASGQGLNTFTWNGLELDTFTSLALTSSPDLINAGQSIFAWYAQGAAIYNVGNITPGDVATEDAIVFSGTSSAAINSPVYGAVPYGAFWGRILAAEEILQLHNDPYCFLIFPEDDLFSGGKGNKLYFQSLNAISNALPAILIKQAKKKPTVTMEAIAEMMREMDITISTDAGSSAVLAEQKLAKEVTLSATAYAAGASQYSGDYSYDFEYGIIKDVLIDVSASVEIEPSLVISLVMKTLAATVAVAAAMAQSGIKVITASAGTSASIVRGILQALLGSVLGSSTLAQAVMVQISAIAAQMQAAVTWTAQKTLAVAVHAVGSLPRSLPMAMSASVYAAATTSRKMTMSLSSTAIAVGTMGRDQVKIMVATVAATVSALLLTTEQPLSATAKAAGSVARTIAKAKTATAEAVSSLAKLYQKLMPANVATDPDVTKTASLVRRVQSGTAAALQEAPQRNRALSATAKGSANLTRSLFKSLAAAVDTAVSLIISTIYSPARQISIVNESFNFASIINESFAGMTAAIIVGPQARTSFLGTNGYSPVMIGTTPSYTGQLVDETGIPISAASLNTLTLTIIDTISGSVINNCNDVNILNTGRGAVDNDGNLTIVLETGDTGLFNALDQVEERSLIIDWTYNGGTRTAVHQVDFELQAPSSN